MNVFLIVGFADCTGSSLFGSILNKQKQELAVSCSSSMYLGTMNDKKLHKTAHQPVGVDRAPQLFNVFCLFVIQFTVWFADSVLLLVRRKSRIKKLQTCCPTRSCWCLGANRSNFIFIFSLVHRRIKPQLNADVRSILITSDNFANSLVAHCWSCKPAWQLPCCECKDCVENPQHCGHLALMGFDD